MPPKNEKSPPPTSRTVSAKKNEQRHVGTKVARNRRDPGNSTPPGPLSTVAPMRLLTTVTILGLVAGCSSRTTAARIADLELPEPTSTTPALDGQRVLVRRFTDGRPSEYGRHLGGGGIAVPGGYQSEYTMTYRKRGKRGASTVYQGWLPVELPHLFARSLPGAEVRVADDLPDAGAGQQWDYVVEGRLEASRHSHQMSVALIYLGLIGLPTQFARYELRYEVTLYDGADPDPPLLQRSYEFDEKVTAGLYYNLRRIEDLPLDALTSTLSASAADVTAEIAKHQARERAVPERQDTAVATATETVPSE